MRQRRVARAPACGWAKSRSSRVRASAGWACACLSAQSSATASTAELEREALGRFRRRHGRAWRGLTARRSMVRPARSGAASASHSRNSTSADPDSGIVDADRALEIARTARTRRARRGSANQKFRRRRIRLGRYHVVFANSQGFAGEYAGTSLQPRRRADRRRRRRDAARATGTRKVAASTASKMPTRSGLTAAKRALRRLGARKIKTTRAPVVFDPDMAASLLRALVGAASGPSLYRARRSWSASWARKSPARGVTIIDDGTMRGGLGSKPFDGEGLPTTRKSVVESGVLKTYLLDSLFGAQARHASRPATPRARSATRPRSARPISTCEPGTYTPEEIIAHGQERPLSDRADRLRRQLGHRRLFARRGRNVDRRTASLPTRCRKSRSPATSRTCSCRSR